MKSAPKVGKIGFAIIDVKGGRKALAKLVKDHKHRVPITLSGYLTSVWSGDDGVSIEFEMDVRKQRIKKPVPQFCECVRCEAVRVEPKAKSSRKDRSDPEGGIPGRSA